MAQGEMDAQRSHRLSSDSRQKRRSDSSKQGRSRKGSSVVSFTPSVPSIRSTATVSTTSIYRTSASIRDEPDSPDSQSSFESIVDDPFFQRYHAADVRDDAKEFRDPSPVSVRHASPPPKPRPVPPPKELLTTRKSDALVCLVESGPDCVRVDASIPSN